MFFCLLLLMFIILNDICVINSTYEENCLFENCNCYNDREDFIVSCPGNINIFPKLVGGNGESIEYFQLNNNKDVKIIPERAFYNVTIKEIDLANNGLTFIHQDAFESLSGLVILLLQENAIEQLDKLVFLPIAGTIENLNLNENQLGNMDNIQFTLLFKELRRLKELSLNKNNLTLFPDLRNNTILIDVELKDNLIETIISNDGYSLLPNSLKAIDLEKNQIKKLEANWFGNTEDLEIINLANNYIEQIEQDTFINLKKLKKLDLSKNSILTSIPKIPSLESLSLSNTGITKIRKHDFYMGAVFGVIDLGENEIKYMDSIVFCSNVTGKPIEIRSEIKVEFSLNATIDICPLYYQLINVKKSAKLRLKNLKCDCGIELLATKFELEGYCLDDNYKVAMSDYKCEDRGLYSIMCSEREKYSCGNDSEIAILSTTEEQKTTEFQDYTQTETSRIIETTVTRQITTASILLSTLTEQPTTVTTVRTMSSKDTILASKILLIFTIFQTSILNILLIR